MNIGKLSECRFTVKDKQLITAEKIILGTVQFGINYGINNSTGQLTESEAQKVLEYAAAVGIRSLDTAAAYGNAEKVIGRYHSYHDPFKIITKFDKETGKTWKDSIKSSIQRLNVSNVQIAMFHSFAEYKKNQPFLSQIISEGKGVYFNQLGVSVYTNDELLDLMDDERVDVIQLPFNLLDNERLRGESIKNLKDKGKIIHTRSVFLQGLFFMDLQNLHPKFNGIKGQLQEMHRLAIEQNVSVSTLALQYVLSKEYIDGVLLGVDSAEHLQQNFNALEATIDNSIFTEIDKIHTIDKEMLNPVNW